jgi:hypothetical protein
MAAAEGPVILHLCHHCHPWSMQRLLTHGHKNQLVNIEQEFSSLKTQPAGWISETDTQRPLAIFFICLCQNIIRIQAL